MQSGSVSIRCLLVDRIHDFVVNGQIMDHDFTHQDQKNIQCFLKFDSIGHLKVFRANWGCLVGIPLVMKGQLNFRLSTTNPIFLDLELSVKFVL